MKKILIVTASLLFFTFGFSVAQESDLQKIKKLMKQGEDFWNKGDIEGYVSLYAPVDSCRMLYSSGATYGRANILAFYQKYWPKEKMGQLSYDEMTIEKLSNDYYFSTGYFHVRYSDGKSVDGRFSVLLKKINGQWYIYTDHSG